MVSDRLPDVFLHTDVWVQIIFRGCIIGLRLGFTLWWSCSCFLCSFLLEESLFLALLHCKTVSHLLIASAVKDWMQLTLALAQASLAGDGISECFGSSRAAVLVRHGDQYKDPNVEHKRQKFGSGVDKSPMTGFDLK